MEFQFKLYVYPHHVRVFYYPTMEETITAHSKRFHIDGLDNDFKFDALTTYPTSHSSDKVISVLLSKDCSNALLSNIHHESIHVATYTLNYCGVIISEANDEALTYLSTYIFTTICKKLKLIQ